MNESYSEYPRKWFVSKNVARGSSPTKATWTIKVISYLGVNRPQPKRYLDSLQHFILFQRTYLEDMEGFEPTLDIGPQINLLPTDFTTLSTYP